MFPDYSKTPEPIWKILLLFERLYFPVGPKVIRSGSDDGILEKSRELLNYYRHTYSDFGIFINNAIICTQKVSFGEVELVKMANGTL